MLKLICVISYFFLFITYAYPKDKKVSHLSLFFDKNKAMNFYEAEEFLKGIDKDRLIYGGNLGLSFGDNLFSIALAPNIGYRFNSYIAAGLGINYRHTSLTIGNICSTLGYVGGQTYVRYYAIPNITLFANPELNLRFGSERDLNTNIRVSVPNTLVPSVVVGVAYSVSRGFGFTGFIGYDIVQHRYTPYDNIVLGLNVGIF